MTGQTVTFKSEQQLVNCFKENYHAYFNYLNFVEEIEGTNGIADLVLFRLNRNKENITNLKNINPRWVYALKQLPYRKNFYLEYFIERTGTSRETAIKHLKSFESAGYCIKVGEKWRKLKEPMAVSNKLVAIEAKLKNWKRALYQAARYLDYANESWVVLDCKHSGSAINGIDEFKKMNVGLSDIDSCGNIRIIWKPICQHPRSQMSRWYINGQIVKEYFNCL